MVQLDGILNTILYVPYAPLSEARCLYPTVDSSELRLVWGCWDRGFVQAPLFRWLDDAAGTRCSEPLGRRRGDGPGPFGEKGGGWFFLGEGAETLNPKP